MENKERAEELKQEIERLKEELKGLTGECTLDLKNRRMLKYPYVSLAPRDGSMEIWKSTLNIDSLSVMVRLMLAPEARTLKNGRMRTAAKKVKDLTREEYKAVCACIDEVIEVMDRHNKELHPEGIATGRYVDGMELYRPVRRPQIVPETKEVG